MRSAAGSPADPAITSTATSAIRRVHNIGMSPLAGKWLNAVRRDVPARSAMSAIVVSS